MLKLADLEKEYLVSCAHCAKPMPAWELFCPSCNQEQSPPERAGDASQEARSKDSATDASETAASGVIEFLRPQQEDWDSVDQLISTTAANEELGFGLGDVRPGAILQDASAATHGPLQVEASGRSIDMRRVTLGVAATLVVALLLALMYDTFVLRSSDAENVETRAVAATAGPARDTASRDNPGGAERLPGGPDDGQSKGAAALASTGAADRPVEEHAGQDESLRDIAVSAVQALGLSEPIAPPDPTPMPQAVSTAALPVGAMGAADSTDKACTAAHAALALCQAR